MVLLRHWYFAIVEKNPDFTVDGCLLGAFENRDVPELTHDAHAR